VSARPRAQGGGFSAPIARRCCSNTGRSSAFAHAVVIDPRQCLRRRRKSGAPLSASENRGPPRRLLEEALPPPPGDMRIEARSPQLQKTQRPGFAQTPCHARPSAALVLLRARLGGSTEAPKTLPRLSPPAHRGPESCTRPGRLTARLSPSLIGDEPAPDRGRRIPPSIKNPGSRKDRGERRAKGQEPQAGHTSSGFLRKAINPASPPHGPPQASRRAGPSK